MQFLFKSCLMFKTAVASGPETEYLFCLFLVLLEHEILVIGMLHVVLLGVVLQHLDLTGVVA